VSRILFITPGLYFDPTIASTRLRYEALSNAGFSGHVLCVIYEREHHGEKIGNFIVRGLYLPAFLQGYGPLRGLLRAFLYMSFSLFNGISLRRNVDISIASDTFKSGALCLLLKILVDIPYAIEVSGNYIRSFTVNSESNSISERLKHYLVQRITPPVVRRASAIKLLYEGQLDGLASVTDNSKLHIFHNIVELDKFHPADNAEKLVLSIGHPWHLKGMDIIIKAFNRICRDIPDFRLKIVGYCTDIREFEQLAGDNENIELINQGVPYDQVAELIGSCSIFVLASRTEAMGRVLLEAMASRKPIIASAVDGIPRIIKDGWNGLLFEPEDSDALANRILKLATDPEYANTLASNAHSDVFSRLSTETYVEKYRAMVASALGKNSTR
jgi:glycosyltransferase involved in cell wall biosynthesis